MTNEVTRLPIPERLEPKNAKRSLQMNVKSYFYPLYNSTDKTFQEYLVSVGNKDAVTGRRDFDRHQVGMIKQQAKLAKDALTSEASDGDVYDAMVKVMRDHPELSLKLRRSQYARLGHQQAAE